MVTASVGCASLDPAAAAEYPIADNVETAESPIINIDLEFTRFSSKEACTFANGTPHGATDFVASCVARSKRERPRGQRVGEKELAKTRFAPLPSARDTA
jgi:hypothetical protein